MSDAPAGTTRTFRWSARTPDGPAATGECELLVVHTERGETAILADHAALVACVLPGELRVSEHGVVRRFGVGPGILEVRGGVVSLLLSSPPEPRPA